MSEPRKKGRRAYLSHYKKKEDGGYAYTGKMYTCESSEDYKHIKLRLWLFVGCIFACVVAAGCVSPPGANGQIFVLLPYVAGLMTAVSLVWAMCRLSVRGPALEEHVYEATAKAIPIRAMAVLILMVLSLAGLIVYVCFNGFEDKFIHFLISCLTQVLSIVFCLALWRYMKTISWRDVPSQN